MENRKMLCKPYEHGLKVIVPHTRKFLNICLKNGSMQWGSAV